MNFILKLIQSLVDIENNCFVKMRFVYQSLLFCGLMSIGSVIGDACGNWSPCDPNSWQQFVADIDRGVSASSTIRNTANLVTCSNSVMIHYQ
jgi:hypothetical protein